MEPPLFLGKTGFPNRENSEIFSQIFPRSLLGKPRTTIYRVSMPENHDIVGLFSQSASSSGLRPAPQNASHNTTYCVITSQINNI